MNDSPEFQICVGNSALGQLLDVRGDVGNMTFYKEFVEYFLARVDGFTDGKLDHNFYNSIQNRFCSTQGEVVDAVEKYFWGMHNGLAMEIGEFTASIFFATILTYGKGALDGSPNTRSMTYEYEKSFRWKRILVDAVNLINFAA